MPNVKNLKPGGTPGGYSLSREEASKGGKRSAETRRAKKTIRTLLNDYLEQDCKESPQFKQIAAQLGMDGDESIKKLFTVVCMLNTVKHGELKDLELLTELLGEADAPEEYGAVSEDDPLTAALKEEAERMKQNALATRGLHGAVEDNPGGER